MSPDEKITGEKIEVPDIDTAGEAFLFIAFGISFFFKNYKKTTVAVLLLIVFLAVQFFNNFDQIKGLASLVGIGL